MRSETKAFLGALASIILVVCVMLLSRCDPWRFGKQSVEQKDTTVVEAPALPTGEKWYFSEHHSPFDTVALVNWDKATGRFECFLPDGRKLVGKEDRSFLVIDGEVYFEGKVDGTFQLHQWPSKPMGTFLTGNINRRAAELKRHDFKAKQ